MEELRGKFRLSYLTIPGSGAMYQCLPVIDGGAFHLSEVAFSGAVPVPDAAPSSVAKTKVALLHKAPEVVSYRVDFSRRILYDEGGSVAKQAGRATFFGVSEEDRTIPHSGGFFLYNRIIPGPVLFQTKEAKKGNLRKGSKGCHLRIE